MNIFRNNKIVLIMLLGSIITNCFLACLGFNLWRKNRSAQLYSRLFEDNYYFYKRKFEYWRDRGIEKLEKKGDIVFLGDSITEMMPVYDYLDLWRIDGDTILVNKGMSGNKTEQMLARFKSDVINLEPKIVVIFGGVCDFHYKDHSAQEAIDNLDAMIKMSIAHDITPVVCTILPFFKIENRPYKEKLFMLNDWIRKQENAIVVDYFSAFADKEGYLKGKMLYSIDGTHPTKKGYQLMAQTLKETLIKLNSSLK